MARKDDPTNELTLDDGGPANRRKSPRVPVRVWAENRGFEEFSIWLAAEDIRQDFAFCYRTCDLSADGIFLETTTPLDVGTEMNLSFKLPGGDRSVQVAGEVVRISHRGESGPPGMAVIFHHVDPTVRASLDAFVIARNSLA